MKKKLLILLAMVLIAACLLVSCITVTTEKQPVRITVNTFANYELFQGDELDFTDATIAIIYSDGTKEIVPLTKDMVAGYNKNKVGVATLDVTYGKLKTSVDVEVKALKVQKIAIKEAPESIEVVQGGTLDLTGISIEIFYQNKSSVMENITKDMITGFSADMELGEHTVYVNLSGYQAPISVRVVDKSIVDIEVVNSPSINNYFVGDPFNPNGLSIRLYYDNDTVEDVVYTSETEGRFRFDYDFSFALSSSPVTITYLGEYSTIHYLVVTEPVCTNVEFEYAEAVFNPMTGTSSMVRYNYYPTSFGVYIDGIRQTPNPITALVEGDGIDWSTGKARLTFDDGSTKLVSLSDNSIIVQARNSDGQLVNFKDHVYNEVGTYELAVTYGNMNKSTPLYITVKAKRAIKMTLANTETVTKQNQNDRIYYDGDKVVIDLIRYNILYDNGTYLCDKNDVEEWSRITVDMLDEDSDLVVDHSNAINGKQRIGFKKDGVSAYIDVVVEAVKLVDSKCILNEPVQNVVLIGNDQSLTGGSLYLVYNNGKFETVDLTWDMITYYFNNGTTEIRLDKLDEAEEPGEYIAVISYKSLNRFYEVQVADVAVTAITIANPPSDTMVFESFDTMDFRSLNLEVTYSQSDLDETLYPQFVQVTNDMLYNCDMYNVGYQEVNFRYGGVLSGSLPIKINGRYETYIKINKAPNKIVYQVGEEFDVSGMVINKFYSDNTHIDISEFDSRWVFTPDDNSTVGQKRLAIALKDSTGKNVGEVVYLKYYVVSGTVDSIEVDTNQDGFIDYYDATSSKTIRVYKVTKYDFLSTFGLKLKVVYADKDNQGVNYSQYIDLESSYVNYDRTLEIRDAQNNVVPTRQLTVNYGGKTTTFWILIVERYITSIAVVQTPTINIYADGQSLNLNGGILRRDFSDGTSDCIQMQSGLIEHDYNSNYFATFVSNDRYVDQNVTISYGGCFTSMTVRTYRRTTAEELVSYSDTVSFYGNVQTPVITVVTNIANFVAPEWELYYNVNGVWTTTRPSVPGTYSLRLEVLDNDFYMGSTIDGQKMVIMVKIIEVRANDASKVYGEDDPDLGYVVEGDSMDIYGNPINTVLVWNYNEKGELVQDRLQLKMVRAEGENVILDKTGAVVGYEISYELVAGDNQNDRYSIDFKPGIFKIEQLEVTEVVSFSGWQNLKANGTPRIITASFTRAGSNVIIDAKDMIYYSGEVLTDDYKLSEVPKDAGTYTVQVSKNYKISGKNYCKYTINAV